MGRWRSKRGSSVPWRSVMVRPQRRQLVLVRVLSTVRISSPALVISVWSTRTSGMSSGIEMSGCLGIGYHPSVSLANSGAILHHLDPRRKPLYLEAPTASPEEPHIY